MMRKVKSSRFMGLEDGNQNGTTSHKIMND